MKYDALYFLKKFDAIPEDKWTTYFLTNKFGQHCVLGHCGVTIFNMSSEGLKLYDILYSPVGINDGYGIYKQLGDTPKERIMNALLLVNAGVEL